MTRDASRPGHLAVGWTIGALLGAVAGLGLLLWETLVLRLAHVEFARPEEQVGLFVVYVAVGALVGGSAASTGARGPRWAIAAAWAAVGWLAAPAGAAVVASVGLPGVLGLFVPPVVGTGLGLALSRVRLPAWMHLGSAAWLWCALAVVVPLQHHLLVGISTEVALCMGAVAAMALVFAAFTSAFAVEGRAPVVPLVSWAALGGLLLGLLSLRPERVVLPALAEGDPIVLVVVSGLRADHTGLGSARPSVTPQLDAFGEEALVFEDAHTTSNWSVPSIASVLTGRSPYRHGAGHHDGERQRHTALQPDVDTLASALRRSGYATMAMVGDPRLRLYGLDRGFDGWVEAPKRGAVPTLWRLVEASGVAPLAWPRTVSADEVSDRAIAWVEQQAPEGWFLFVQYADAAVEGPHAAYPEAVAQADEAIGRLLDALPADAWVVIVGDRGRSLGEEHVEMLRTARGSSYGDHAYEEVTHIPLGLRLPTLVPGRMAETVSVVDVAPTILTALSHAPLPLADGVPLEPVFGLPLAPRVVTSQSSRWGLELQSVIAFDHKLMVTRDGRTRLYDRAADPYEQAPLPVGLEQDDLQRQLLSALPPPGGVRVHEDWTVRFSQLAGRLLGRR